MNDIKPIINCSHARRTLCVDLRDVRRVRVRVRVTSKGGLADWAGPQPPSAAPTRNGLIERARQRSANRSAIRTHVHNAKLIGTSFFAAAAVRCRRKWRHDGARARPNIPTSCIALSSPNPNGQKNATVTHISDTRNHYKKVDRPTVFYVHMYNTSGMGGMGSNYLSSLEFFHTATYGRVTHTRAH